MAIMNNVYYYYGNKYIQCVVLCQWPNIQCIIIDNDDNG